MTAPILTKDYVEYNYDNRSRVPQHPQYFARWAELSQKARDNQKHHANLAYGPHERHRIDFFPAENSDRLLVFIHGGYWRALSKDMFSWIAAPYVARGINVALLNYRLCPEVTIDAIVEDCALAMNWLAFHARGFMAPPKQAVLAGHSAGGHLVGVLATKGAKALGFEPAQIVGGVMISGLFDLAPLLMFSGNSDFRLTEASAKALSPVHQKSQLAVPLIAAAGGAETIEFVRQTVLIANHWPERTGEAMLVPQLDHFTIVDAFANPQHALFKRTAALFK